MAKETQIGQLVIDLQIKTNALEKGLETAKKKLQEIEQENKKIENSNKGLDASFLALSATVVVALTKIEGTIKNCIDEYKAYTQAMSSLKNVSDYTGESMEDFSEIMNKFSVYMTKSDLATTIKNFSLMGMSAKDTEKMIESLTNSAIRNRNANYTVSEAVRVASEGYRQGLSTLSDSAGVTENLSVMLDKYAQSIGKTASQLTDAEKNQAYLNRTMYASEPFVGAMSEYMDTLAGKQGAYSQAMRETQVAYTEALEPTLIKLEQIKTNAIKTLGELISMNEGATVGTTTFVVTLGTLIVAIMGVKKAYDIYKASAFSATVATDGFTVALTKNPIGLIAVAIATAISGISMLCTAINENEEAQAKLNKTTQEYQAIKDGKYMYTDENISSAQANKKAIEEQITLLEQMIHYQKIVDAYKTQEEQKKQDTISTGLIEITKNEYQEAESSLKSLEKAYENAIKENGKFGDSLNSLQKKLKTYNAYLKEADAVEKIKKATDVENIKTMQIQASTLDKNAKQMQEYLNIVKKGDKQTTEYQKAVAELAKTYPEAVSAEGVLIDQAQGFISAEQLKADEAWKTSQDTINSYIDIINTALNSEGVQQQVAQNVGKSWEEIAPGLQSILNLLQLMAGYTPTTTPGVTPTTYRSSGGSSYSNKKLDNYKKEIEYKKSLDQISLQEELDMYWYALNRYAKTQDEKRDLEVKLYELEKELKDKRLADDSAVIEHRKALNQLTIEEEIGLYEWELKNLAYTTEQKRELEVKLYELQQELIEKQIEDRRKSLDKQIKDYEDYIDTQTELRGAEFAISEKIAEYDKIIAEHQKYLDEIIKNEQIALEEKEDMMQEELETIKSYERQKRDLRVSSVNDTVLQLKNAIEKQIQETQKAEEKAIEEEIELIEKARDIKIESINKTYEKKIEAINKELNALNKAEKQKSRTEEDTEYNTKKKRLEELVAFEHDAVTKANYQKELDKLIEEQQKTIDKRMLEDKKESLKNEQESLKEQQQNKIEAIKKETTAKIDGYKQQLNAMNEYYEKQIATAEETSQKMLLNAENTQEEIIQLLETYGDAYEITGQTFGEKLAQGFAEIATQKIESAISAIQKRIDNALESNIAKLATQTELAYNGSAGSNDTTNKTVVINQNNTITTPIDSPSTQYKKQETLNRQLAEQVAQVF